MVRTFATVRPMADSGAFGMGFVDNRVRQAMWARPFDHRRGRSPRNGSVVQAQGEITIAYSLAAKSGPPVKLESDVHRASLDAHEMILALAGSRQ